MSTSTPPFTRPEDFPTTAGDDGRFAWQLGLLGLIPIPGIAALATGLTMVIVGLRQRAKNPVAARTGRAAAIFGATLLAAVVVYAAIMAIGFTTMDPDATYDSIPPLMLAAAPFMVWMVFLGPLVGIVMGIIALARPVSREKAARILAPRAG